MLEESISTKNENQLRKILRLSLLKKKGLLFNSEFLKYINHTELALHNSLSNSSDISLDNYSALDKTINPFENNFSRAKRFSLNQNVVSQSIDFSIVQFLFPFCLKVDSKVFKCTECVDGYFLDENFICQEIYVQGGSSCLVYKSFDRCGQCIDGFDLNDFDECEAVVQTGDDERNNLRMIKIPTLTQEFETELTLLPSIDDEIIDGNLKKPEISPSPDDNSNNIIPVTPTDTTNNSNNNPSPSTKNPDPSTETPSSENPEINKNQIPVNIVPLPELPTQPTNETKNVPEKENPKNPETNTSPTTTTTETKSPTDTKPLNPQDQNPINENNETTNQTSNSNLFSLIENLKNIPEEEMEVDEFSLVNSFGNPIPYTNNRTYLFRRRYSRNDDENSGVEKDYGVLMANSEIVLLEEEDEVDDQGKNVIKSINISLNCEIVKIENVSDVPSCLKCKNESEHILSPISEQEQLILHCVARQRIIPNCNSYKSKEEKCSSCLEGHFLWEFNSSQNCFKNLDGCEQNNIEEGILKCSQCSDSHQLNGNICQIKQPPIPNCGSQNGNVCVVCNQGFFKFKNLCIAELAFSFIFCPLDNNGECVCEDNTFHVSSVDECVPISNDNCYEYDSNNNCIKCKNGYYLVSSKICVKGEIESCKEYSVGSNNEQFCLSCEDPYVLENNICRSKLSIFTSNCEESTGEFCLQCSPNHFRIDLTENPSPLSICAPKTLNQSYSSIDNCLIFNSISKSCELCQEGLFINDNGGCSQCDFTINAINNLNNKCITPASLVFGCELYNDDFCVKCQKDDLPAIFDEELFTLKTRVYSDRSKNIYFDKPNFVINQCNVVLSDSCFTDNCEAAINLKSGSTCCSKCTKGRSGIWSREDKLFFTSSCDTLVEFCDVNSSIKEIPMEYSKYLTCERCTDNKIVQLNLVEGLNQIECIDIPEDEPELQNCIVKIDNDCRMCIPGFRAIELPDKKIICQEINNCAFSNTIDKCEECNEGYSLTKEENSCIPSPIVNCKQVNDAFECARCNNGMILKNKKCFSISDPLCARYDSENCLECSSNERSIPSLIFTTNFTQVSQFTDHKKSFCLNSSSSPWLNSIKNCKYFSSSEFCSECNPGYSPQIISLSERICIESPSGSPNCILFNADSSCLKCAHNYYLEGDRCWKGTLSNCLSYTDMLNCEECDSGYDLIEIDGQKLCYLSHSIANCERSVLVQNKSSLSLSCDFCQPIFRPKKIITSEKLCFPLRNQKNCRKVDSSSSLCTECDDYYFLDGSSQCVNRTNLSIQNCLVLHPRDDSCFQCENNYVLSQDSLRCDLRDYPLGPGCKLQLPNSMKCLLCDPLFVFNSENQCEQVINPIPNCVEYSNQTTCTKCSFGYLLPLGNPSNICLKQISTTNDMDVRTVLNEDSLDKLSLISNGELNITDKTNTNTVQIDDILQELPTLPNRILQSESINLLDQVANPSQIINNSINTISETAANQIVGENTNSFVKDMVKNQVISSIKDKTDPATESINTIKNNIINISDSKQLMLKDTLENLNPNMFISIDNDKQPVTLNPSPNNSINQSSNNDTSNNGGNVGNPDNVVSDNGGSGSSKKDGFGFKCGLCSEGFSFSFLSNICTKNSEVGCFLMKKIPNSADVCEICMSGYFQLQDGGCVKNISESVSIITISKIFFLLFLITELI